MEQYPLCKQVMSLCLQQWLCGLVAVWPAISKLQIPSGSLLPDLIIRTYSFSPINHYNYLQTSSSYIMDNNKNSASHVRDTKSATELKVQRAILAFLAQRRKAFETLQATGSSRNRDAYEEADRGEIKWRFPDWRPQGSPPSANESAPLSPKSGETLSYEEFCAMANAESTGLPNSVSLADVTKDYFPLRSLRCPGCRGEVEVGSPGSDERAYCGEFCDDCVPKTA